MKLTRARDWRGLRQSISLHDGQASPKKRECYVGRERRAARNQDPNAAAHGLAQLFQNHYVSQTMLEPKAQWNRLMLGHELRPLLTDLDRPGHNRGVQLS